MKESSLNCNNIKFNNSMSSVIKNMAMLQESTQRATRIIPQFQSLYVGNIFDVAQSPLIEAFEQMNRIHEPLRASLTKFNSINVQAAEIFRNNFNTYNESLRGLEDFLTINKNFLSAFHNKAKNFIDLNATFAIGDIALHTKGIEFSIRENVQLLKNIDFSSIVDSNDEFDIESTLDEVVIYLDSNISIQQKISNILEKFKSANPIIVLLIYFFILSPLQSAYDDAVLNLITSNTKTTITEFNTSATKVVEKNIKVEVNNILNVNVDSDEEKNQILNKYRYVNTNELIIRKNKSVNSKPLYTLEFGQVVKLLYKNKNWTLIEYTDDENNIIQGWVFTRYISRFKK